MALTTNDPRDIEKAIDEGDFAPQFFPPFTIAMKPAGPKGTRYRGIYITDTNKPAWQGADGVWRYADGSSV